MIVDRRALLTAAGVGSAAYFLPWLRSARAATTEIPKRIVFFWGCPTLRGKEDPKPVGSNPVATETEFDVSEMLAPLAAYRDRMVLLKNLDMLSARVDNTGFGGSAHGKGDLHALVSATATAPGVAGGTSIDQHIAKGLSAKGPLTPFPSLELQLSDFPGALDPVCFDANGRSLPLEQNPIRLFSRLFAGQQLPPGTRSRRASVLDYVQAETRAVKGRASRFDQLRLDAHLSSVRDLEARLDVVRACTPPSDVKSGQGLSGGALFQSNFDAHTSIVASTLACDLARVVTMYVPSPPDLSLGYTVGAFGSDNLHDLQHKTAENGSMKDNPDAVGMVETGYLLYAKWFNSFLDKLAAIPEADGTTVLDHTLVVYCGQIASASHVLDQLPWFIVGGGSAGVKTGRFLDFGRVNNAGLGHNRLFISLANQMGVPTQTFGNPSLAQGDLPRLFA